MKRIHSGEAFISNVEINILETLFDFSLLLALSTFQALHYSLIPILMVVECFVLLNYKIQPRW